MIKITRSRAANKLPKGFTGPALVNKLMLLAQARLESETIKFTGAIGDWKKAKPVLKKETRGKCCYCEADTATVAHGDVEHFRPKSVYWWLALCIDNYTYSCQICNQTYKGNEFPVLGPRLKAPKLPAALPGTAAKQAKLAAKICPDPATVSDAELRSVWFKENGDLPNPYLEDPEELFAWKVAPVSQEVHLVPSNNAARAKRAVTAAVDYLGLNRETLTRSRFLAYAPLHFALDIWETSQPGLSTRAEAEIRRLCDSRCTFAGMSRYFARQRGFPV